MTYNPDTHHRNSIRLQSYDYRSAGAYFVTICTFQKEPILAEITDGEARLTPAGVVVQKCWDEIPSHFPNVELDHFVIMPNHLHGIIMIHDTVGATQAAPLHGQSGPPKRSVGAIVGSFKSACTKRINELRNAPGLPVWQRNYHERVIRNDDELHALRDYIHNNPASWEEDPERRQDMETAENDMEPFRRLVEIVERSGVPSRIHEHRATRTVEEAEQNLSFEVARIVKTVAFRTRSGGIVLAAVRGIRRVDYARLAALVGVNRRHLAALSPEDVREELGIEPGSVSPLPLRGDALLLIDDDVLTILPTLYCGIGRSDRTLEMAPDALVQVTSGRVGGFSREGK